MTPRGRTLNKGRKASPTKKKVSPKKSGGKAMKKATVRKSNPRTEEQEWEVVKILGVKEGDRGQREFLVQWSGNWPQQWLPEAQLGCPDLKKAFWNRMKQ